MNNSDWRQPVKKQPIWAAFFLCNEILPSYRDMFVDQSNEIMKNKGQVNLEALHSDFEKVIKVLNSSTIQQHVTASDRMLELLVKKWDSMVEKSQGSVNIMSILLSMLPIYKTNRELVSKRLTIIQ